MTERTLVVPEPRAVFASLQTAFERARTAHPGGLSAASYTLAGRTVELRVVGRKLAECLARPFGHLASHAAPEAAALTIDLWEAAETGVPGPACSMPTDLGDSGIVTSSRDGRFLAYERPFSVMTLDRRNHHLVGWVGSATRLPLGERARPLSLPLAVWLSDQDIPLIHAGLVAKRGHGVLLAGFAAAGKSTTALACALAGFEFVADDCVALPASTEGELHGHSLYSSITLEHKQRGSFPPDPSSDSGDASWDEKALIFAGEASQLRVARAAPIRVVALPRIVTAPDSRSVPATKAEALLRLAPSSLAKRAVNPQACLSRMAMLVDRVPSYWLDVDRELAEIPRRVERLLTEVGLA